MFHTQVARGKSTCNTHDIVANNQTPCGGNTVSRGTQRVFHQPYWNNLSCDLTSNCFHLAQLITHFCGNGFLQKHVTHPPFYVNAFCLKTHPLGSTLQNEDEEKMEFIRQIWWWKCSVRGFQLFSPTAGAGSLPGCL